MILVPGYIKHCLYTSSYLVKRKKNFSEAVHDFSSYFKIRLLIENVFRLIGIPAVLLSASKNDHIEHIDMQTIIVSDFGTEEGIFLFLTKKEHF